MRLLWWLYISYVIYEVLFLWYPGRSSSLRLTILCSVKMRQAEPRLPQQPGAIVRSLPGIYVMNGIVRKKGHQIMSTEFVSRLSLREEDEGMWVTYLKGNLQRYYR